MQAKIVPYSDFFRENMLEETGKGCGWGTAYVYIEKGHPMFGKHFSEIQMILTRMSPEFAATGKQLTYSDISADGNTWVVSIASDNINDDIINCSREIMTTTIQLIRDLLVSM